MNNLFLNIVLLVIGVVASGTISYFIVQQKRKKVDIDAVRKKSEEIIEKNQKEGATILDETRTRTQRRRENLKSEVERRENHIKKVKQSLTDREEVFKKREDKTRQVKLSLTSEKEFLSSAQNAIKDIEQQSLQQLTQITGTTTEQLKEEILTSYKEEFEKSGIEKLRNLEDNLKEDANKIAKKILIIVMQRLSSPTSVESRAVHIKVPKDHIKGKIIGKDAQNIVEIEKHLDVDIIFNDIPNTITISAFNLVNRRIAEKAIENLVKVRGEINKKVIEIALERAERETDSELFAIGRRTIQQIGIKIENKELIRIIGRLQYRTSYGQNIMKHSMEVAYVATMLGGELGVNIDTCRVSGFLHDLGKAIDQNPDIQGAHDYLTKELMEKYNFKEEEIHAAWTHHGSEAPSTPEALLVQAADAVSACRPGARQESIEKYIEKLQALEETACSFEGVRNTYAISAGRELRIIVDPEVVSDESMDDMTTNVVEKIEDELSYPGTIKVNVIRRTQHIEIAK